MFLRRTLFTVTALPIGLFFVFTGGWLFAAFITAILMRAAWEYARLFRAHGLAVSHWLVVGAVTAISLARFTSGFANDHWLFVLVCMVTLVYYLVQYERGSQTAASEFVATLSGIFYIGILGTYMLLIHQIPEHGEWWIVLSLFAVMLADTTAYMFGTRFGKRRMVPRLSPKKSWEGFLAGLVASVVGTPLFSMLFKVFGLPDDPAFSLANMAIMGLLIGSLTLFGDLGISMIKREMQLKDAGDILPGHGGVLDRIDSWLWAFPIGYYLATLVFLTK
jgi:phosphatidate cytidylyltransferase